jgi:hypothetical protein
VSATLKKVVRLRTSESEIDAEILRLFNQGWTLETINFPAGMIWCVMVFRFDGEKP